LQECGRFAEAGDVAAPCIMTLKSQLGIGAVLGFDFETNEGLTVRRDWERMVCEYVFTVVGEICHEDEFNAKRRYTYCRKGS